MTMVDLQTIAKALRQMSQDCQTPGGVMMLQSFAAWLEGIDLEDQHVELWEEADKLCGAKCLRCGKVRLFVGDQVCTC